MGGAVGGSAGTAHPPSGSQLVTAASVTHPPLAPDENTF